MDASSGRLNNQLLFRLNPIFTVFKAIASKNDFS